MSSYFEQLCVCHICHIKGPCVKMSDIIIFHCIAIVLKMGVCDISALRPVLQTNYLLNHKPPETEIKSVSPLQIFTRS
jgi:hypothetical protein